MFLSTKKAISKIADFKSTKRFNLKQSKYQYSIYTPFDMTFKHDRLNKRPSSMQFIKSYSQYQTVRLIDKNGLKSLISQNEDFILIDVREANEIQESGFIKTSRNLPLSELRNAFLLSERLFEEKYHFRKPSKNDHIVFYCKSGSRSEEATMYTTSLGYQNAFNYSGSYADWIAPIE